MLFCKSSYFTVRLLFHLIFESLQILDDRSATRDRALPVYTKDENKRFAKCAIYTKEILRCDMVSTISYSW